MVIERTKNAVRNTLFGIINKLITLIVPFAVRTVFIRKLGLEYLGLNSLFTSVLSVLSIAELGIGTAIVFDMYSAISSNDSQTLSSLFNFYKKIYRIIGAAVATIGVLISPVIPYLIKADVPSGINLYYIYAIHLLNTLSGYFLFSYRASIIVAHQRNDVISNVATVCSLITSIIQIILLLIGKNYYYYISITVFISVIYNFIIYISSKKLFPDIKPVGEITAEQKKKIKKRVKALFLYRIGGLVLVSADSIVISAFIGLKELAKYNNYFYVIQTLFGFLAVYYSGLTAGIGNSISSETVEKNKADYDKLSFIQKWLICWFSACLLCLYQPFIKLWLGESMLYPFGVVICFTLYFYFWKMMEITNVYKDAAGLWQYDQYRQIVAPAVNLTLNIILVKKIGVYGVILSTVFAIVVIILPWSTYTLFKQYFKYGFKKYMLQYFVDFIIAVLICALSFYITRQIKSDSIFAFVAKVVCCIIVPNLLLFAFYFRSKGFKETEIWIKQKAKKLIIKE